MDFSDLKKAVPFFNGTDRKESVEKEEIKKELADKELVSYQEYGFLQAGRMGGTLAGLKVCLQETYNKFKEIAQTDLQQQELLKRPYKIKIEEYKGHNNTLDTRIQKIKAEDIPAIKSRIEQLRDELYKIKKNPEEIINDDGSRLSFLVGGFILILLTIYLFIFYSSASYSALFKQFGMNDIGIVSSIFDAQALTLSFRDGFTELLLIITIPSVFLGLGYLIHKFQEEKGRKKYIKIGVLIFITFAFDAILAYQISERIYNIIKTDKINGDLMPDYSFKLAFQSINFWMIIFAGFIVYLIWGFVFDFTTKSYNKVGKIQIALREKQLHISESEAALKDLQVQIDKMNYTITDNQKEVNKLNKILEDPVLEKDFQHDIYSFMSGWLAWMKGSYKTHEELDRAEQAAHEFVKNILVTTDPINLKNEV